MVTQHHWLNGHEFEQTPGDTEGQGSLEYCSPWGHSQSHLGDWTTTSLYPLMVWLSSRLPRFNSWAGKYLTSGLLTATLLRSLGLLLLPVRDCFPAAHGPIGITARWADWPGRLCYISQGIVSIASTNIGSPQFPLCFQREVNFMTSKESFKNRKFIQLVRSLFWCARPSFVYVSSLLIIHEENLTRIHPQFV